MRGASSIGFVLVLGVSLASCSLTPIQIPNNPDASARVDIPTPLSQPDLERRLDLRSGGTADTSTIQNLHDQGGISIPPDGTADAQPPGDGGADRGPTSDGALEVGPPIPDGQQPKKEL
jgi:hypothetical protein